MGSSLSIIHNSNGQMASFDHCYCNRAHLPVTQSSNGCRDVGGPLLLGVRIITFESSHQNRDARHYLIGPACQSPNVATGMNHRHVATMNLKRRAPLLRHLFEYTTDSGYKCRSTVRSLSSNRSLSPSLNSPFSKEWYPMTTTSASWRRRSNPQW
jgi:hypothetical protein